MASDTFHRNGRQANVYKSVVPRYWQRPWTVIFTKTGRVRTSIREHQFKTKSEAFAAARDFIGVTK